ncbi:MAG: peroxide stress protein YaaA [Rhodoglobus sp.]|nr:peroxide stress protein YaaA [Rhodoglobus sp.]
MLLVLPPSETKRDGGRDDTSLALASLGFPALTPQRRTAIAALRALSRNLKAAAGGLRLGPGQRFEIDRNRTLGASPVMPALDRYTGVLYEGLDAATMSPSSREFAGEHVVISSALFGLLRADDLIPAYRLSYNSRLPGVSLRKLWAGPVAGQLAGQPGLVLDLRSESYAALGPAPSSAWYLRVLAEDEAGRRTALSHFNKKGKGEFTRAVIESGIDHGSVDSLLEWAAARGIRLSHGSPGELDLVI